MPDRDVQLLLDNGCIWFKCLGCGVELHLKETVDQSLREIEQDENYGGMREFFKSRG